MKFRTIVSGAAVAALSVSFAPASLAQASDDRSANAEVVERAPSGRALAVRVEGKIYQVCQSEDQDNCIQPRAAGLGWGDHPLPYWPGQPASEMRKGG